MSKYIIKRLLYMIPVLLGVAFLVFAILSLTPGDPGTIILGITAKPEAIASLNHEFGYDQPFLIRFFNYIGGIVFHFDLGTSYQTRQPVVNDIIARFPNTLAAGHFIHGSVFHHWNFPWNFFRRPPVFCGGSYLRSSGAGICIYSRILAGADASAFVFLKAWLAAIFWSIQPETLHSANTDGIPDISGRPSASDQIRYAGNHPSGIHPYRKGKRGFQPENHLETCLKKRPASSRHHPWNQFWCFSWRRHHCGDRICYAWNGNADHHSHPAERHSGGHGGNSVSCRTVQSGHPDRGYSVRIY